MSVISTAYDNIVSRLATIYSSSTYKKLVNPYVLELNDTLSLNRGYSFSVGPGVNTKKLVGDTVTLQKEFQLINTIVNRGTERDVTIRETAEKNLLEDQFLAIDSFHRTVLSDSWDFNYESDNGIGFVFTEQQNFITIKSIFILRYSEEC